MTVDIVSPYGSVNAGVRARALSWLSRLGIPWRLTSYFDQGSSAGARQFASHPFEAAKSEFVLRRMASNPPSTLLLRRQASPLSKGRLESRLLRAAGRGVYDIDDALHQDIRGRFFEALFSKESVSRQAAAAADVVIVGNEYLADWATTIAQDVRIIPTCIEPSSYTVKTSYEITGPPRLLWLGTRSGERYLAGLAPALRRLNREFGARVVLIGSPEAGLGAIEAMIDRVTWSLQLANTTIGHHDIGLMPLADTPYERGKCAYKLLEYGAAGLPAVASPVGVNAAILEEAGAPSPRTIDEWYDALRYLIELDPGSRQVLAARLRSVVERDFSFGQFEAAWRDAVVG